MKLLAFAGSTRRGSFNQKLIEAAVQIARDEGADVELISLADFDMPIFNQDLEAEGTPDAALRFKARMKEANGFLISTPEYNSSYPALLKNAIDWASRPADGEPMLAAFSGKACGLLAASPGGLGGIRVLPQLRTLLMNIQVHVVPAQFGLAKAGEAFGDDGSLKDERSAGMVRNVVQQTIAQAKALA